MKTETKPAQHTPGPWKVEERQSGHRWNGQPVSYFSVTHTSETRDCFVALDIAPVTLITSGGELRNAEGEANAVLIASAPELLEALSALLAASESYCDCMDNGGSEAPAANRLLKAHAQARAAISKAKGVTA